MHTRARILLLFAALLLAACGGGGESDNPAAGVEPGGEQQRDELNVDSDAPTRTPQTQEASDFIATPDVTDEAEATLDVMTDSESGDLFAAESTRAPDDTFTGSQDELFGGEGTGT
jgi:hypothetical protein